jgi:hypothetical protein
LASDARGAEPLWKFAEQIWVLGPKAGIPPPPVLPSVTSYKKASYVKNFCKKRSREHRELVLSVLRVNSHIRLTRSVLCFYIRPDIHEHNIVETTNFTEN